MSKKPSYKDYYDSETDTFWRVLKSGNEAYYEEVGTDWIVEYDKDDQIIGFEIRNYLRNFKPISKPKNTGLDSFVYVMKAGVVPDDFMVSFDSKNSFLAYG